MQSKALEAEVINLRKEIEIMKNQHKLIDRQRLKAIQVKYTLPDHTVSSGISVFQEKTFCAGSRRELLGLTSMDVKEFKLTDYR